MKKLQHAKNICVWGLIIAISFVQSFFTILLYNYAFIGFSSDSVGFPVTFFSRSPFAAICAQ